MNASLELTRFNNNSNHNNLETASSVFAGNLERNSLLRVPHYTLQDVEFVEELGEGAFGIH